MKNGQHPGSFRDPSGFIFTINGSIYRQINKIYKENYDHLFNSGLYKFLVENELLIPHEEVDIHPVSPEAYKIVKPEIIPFVSYPYEWCFSQLKDAALVTLKIQQIALEHGMSLKDCSAYNIQFRNGKPIFIDTLSFEKYRENEPWVAYRQFSQHFLAPLAIISYKDIRLGQLLRIYIDGIPLELASSILPYRTSLIFSLLTHIHLQSKSQKHFEDKIVDKEKYKINLHGILSILDSLESAVKKLKWKHQDTEWANYYDSTNYSSIAMQDKKRLIADFLAGMNPVSVWDFGANTGFFSRVASNKGIYTVSFDIDPVAVEKNYQESLEKGEKNILPLLLDLTNPSPDMGWANHERMSILKRGPVDVLFAFALIHHLAISNNLPFNKIADFFNKICKFLLIEFVPKNDSQVQKLLATREDIFHEYTQQIFENEFGKYFIINKSMKIENSERTLYLMEKA